MNNIKNIIGNKGDKRHGESILESLAKTKRNLKMTIIMQIITIIILIGCIIIRIFPSPIDFIIELLKWRLM